MGCAWGLNNGSKPYRREAEMEPLPDERWSWGSLPNTRFLFADIKGVEGITAEHVMLILLDETDASVPELAAAFSYPQSLASLLDEKTEERIYLLLRSLRACGCVTKQREANRWGDVKIEYRLTPHGIDYLNTWVGDDGAPRGTRPHPHTAPNEA